jgi:hypothetical protein
MPNNVTRLFMLVGVLAAWIDLGRLHYLADADSLLPVLVSLQHWTPFYWHQDRFGMLVPLIAMPVRHPLANMLVQGWLTTVAALLAPFLAARYLSDGPHWFAAGAVANALFLAIFTDALRFDWLVAQPFALSMSLAFASLLVAQRSSVGATVASLALMLLAYWANLTVAVIVVPFVLARQFDRRSLWVTGIGLSVGLLIWYLSKDPRYTRTEILPIVQWPHGWLMILHSGLEKIAYPRLCAIVLIVTAVAATRLWTQSPRSDTLKAASSAVVVACIHWFVTGLSLHVQLNDYSARYVLPSVSLFGVAIGLVLVASAHHRRNLATPAIVVALVMATIANYGVPSVKRLRLTIDQRFGAMTQQVIATEATVIVGNYWTVWPAVFHANLFLYERPGPRWRVFGLTYRSDATDALWSNRQEAKQVLAVGYQNDVSIDGYFAGIHLPVTLVGRSGRFAIYQISRN